MRARFLWMLLCFLPGVSALSADSTTNDVIVFGLRHSVITNAELEVTDYENPLTVINTSVCSDGTNCPPSGDVFGASVHLGAADDGIFITPGAEKIDGASLEGTGYATVNGIANSLVGSVRGSRRGYGEYDIRLDFSAIGATGYTYQVYFRDLLAFTGTNLGPDVFVYTGNYEPQRPRVNPLWLKDGRAGVVVDFHGSLAEMDIPGYRIYASKLVIIAESPEHVELASRIDILGSDGLPQFTIGDERVGKFGLHHQSFGAVHFGVKPSQLTLSNMISAPGVSQDGMFTELSRVQRCEATLVPHTVTNETFTWAFNTAGIHGTDYSPSYFGEVRLIGSNGTVNLLAGFNSTGASVRVFQDGVMTGTLTSSNGSLGDLLGSNFVMHSYSASAQATNEPAYIGFQLGNPVTLSNANGVTLTGNEFRVSPVGESETLNQLALLAITGENLGEVTLTGMQTYTPTVEPLQLEIIRSNNVVRVSWPFREDFYPYFKTNLNDNQWNWVSDTIREGWRMYFEWPVTSAPAFFSLRHVYAGFIVTPHTPPVITGNPNP